MQNDQLTHKIERVTLQGEAIKDHFPIYVADVNYVIEQLMRELAIAESELDAKRS